MKILLSSNIPTNKKVNQVGKYLYKHIDGAYKIHNSSNMVDVYMSIYYQIPMLSRKPGGDKEYSDLYEMKLNINITTYQNKIRVNMIEISPEERTLGHKVYKPEQLEDVISACNMIMSDVRKRIVKIFEDYIFVF